MRKMMNLLYSYEKSRKERNSMYVVRIQNMMVGKNQFPIHTFPIL